MFTDKFLYNQYVKREGKRLGRQIAASGEKDPAEHLVTVARRHREETASRLLNEYQSVSFKIFPASATVSTTVSGSMGEAINPHPS